ncbi:MAG: MoxR family ATPase [Scytonema sp. PMC 1069.18]|nr:MoxR family ATPase [Scytonema sp. PMC 1069.18]MEC4883294.1 MoxR family ATPase [Scytonema sp. PMC 1070.18]
MNNTQCHLQYTGEFTDPESPYIPSDELKESVKLAIALKRPLLVMGAPGCGKTRLAGAIAYEFTQRNRALLESLGLKTYPYETWYVKSTSRARDGLYIYDAIGRLRDAQLAAVKQLNEKELERLKDSNQEGYIKFGPLGKAFTSQLRTVLLIDEIDKADIDFPNDLLLELDEKRFFIEETQTWVPAPEQPAPPPIAIVTSNNEKDLPDAFLRRCIFHYLDFPTKDELVKIVSVHFQGKLPKSKSESLTEKIVAEFLQLREDTDKTSGKQVSTSELIDWVAALLEFEAPQNIRTQLKPGKLPFLGLLLKTPDAYIRYKRRYNDTTE